MNPQFPPFNALILDDDPRDTQLISQLIQSLAPHAHVDTCRTIHDALAHCKAKHYECIFLDYFLEGETGIEFIRAHRSRKMQGSVIMITCADQLKEAVECMKEGAIDYITKNQLNAETISKAIGHALRYEEIRQNSLNAESALLESEIRLKSIVARSPIILFHIEGNGIISLFRGKATQALESKGEEISGKNIRDVWQKTPIRIDDYRKACLEEELRFKSEVNNHFFEVNYIPVRNEERVITGMMGVAIDITDFKKSEDRLINTIEETEQAARIKEQFLANMSHEIRTPIHGIISLTRFLLASQLNQEQNQYLELIRKSADTLLVIVNDILDLSKIDADKMTFEEIPFHLKDTLQTSISSMLPKSTEKGIEIKAEIDKNLPERICGDPVRLTQVINNLLGNAVKFTEKGHVSLQARLKTSNSEFAIVEISVSDTGIGIPRSKIDSIFESFTQAGSDITRKYGGTGLGLSITRKLIERQNGEIKVNSEHGKGTTFTFSLPYRLCKEECISPEVNTHTIKLKDNLRILVAEDNDINRLIIDKALKEWGVQVEFATTGVEAVEKVRKSPYDVVLMDVEMPEMNGYKATEIIRNECPEPACSLPIIAMTGNAMVGERKRCLEVGMNEYISKPFQFDELKQLIATMTGTGSTEVVPSVSDTSFETKQSTSKITDLKFLYDISENNHDFFIEFIEMFQLNTPRSIEEIEESVQRGDFEKIRLAAHKVKPSFNYIGLPALSRQCARIEELARNKSGMEEIQSITQDVKSKLKQALVELGEELLLHKNR